MKYRNLSQMHRVQAERLGPRVALRDKHLGLYRDWSWERYRALALACGSALVDVGIQPGDRVGLLAENSVAWLVADMGILAAAGVNVPPHSPLTARQVQYEFEDAGIRWLFVSDETQLAKVLSIRQQLPLLEGIVVFDPHAGAAEPGVYSWHAFLQRGKMALPRLRAELARREEMLEGDDLATIMYTSGTTGNPKGVMLTHGNLLSNALSALEVAQPEPEDLALNWLPLSHIYARLVDHYQTMAGGITLALAESADTLVQNLAEVQPTHIASVPRFYEKLLGSLGDPDPEKTYQRLRRVFGPRIRWISSGGAPLPRSIAEVYLQAGLPVYQGYGLTESSPIISFNRKEHNKAGTVGQAVPGIELTIAADGEILTRGPHVMKGYWKNPAATAEAVRDGWLHTGDLGRLDDEGYLTITGRKKELLVLSNGKKVAPNNIEGLILADECIDQVLVCGEGRNYLTALVVPNWDKVRKAGAEQGLFLSNQSPSEWARDPAVKKWIQDRIERSLKDVSNAEQVRKCILLASPFSLANDELTVSLKVRRSVVLERHRDELAALYTSD